MSDTDIRIVTCMCGKPMELRKEGDDKWEYWYHIDRTDIDRNTWDHLGEHLPILCANCSVPMAWTHSMFVHSPEPRMQVACDNPQPRDIVFVDNNAFSIPIRQERFDASRGRYVITMQVEDWKSRAHPDYILNKDKGL